MTIFPSWVLLFLFLLCFWHLIFWTYFTKKFVYQRNKINSTYLDMDRSWPRIRLMQPSRRRHEPSQCYVGYVPSVIFVNHRTIAVKRNCQSIKWNESPFPCRHLTYPIFAFTDLEYTEFLATCAKHNETLHFIVYLIRIVSRFTVLPIGSESCNEFLPVDETFTVAIEQIGNSTHFHSGRIEFWNLRMENEIPKDIGTRESRLTGIDYSIDEYVTRYQSIVVLVHLTEQIRQAGFLVIHEFEELRRRCHTIRNLSASKPARCRNLLSFSSHPSWIVELVQRPSSTTDDRVDDVVVPTPTSKRNAICPIGYGRVMNGIQLQWSC